ncbi:hypothetical protein HPB49_000507 [Dermacentor silvarum]|uniref:Uncharacterized protein n=1 Tax=Dermacentor silvarum TaxID=543639 RepID=A0ACB8CCR9_DERSI|nr:hypothetical protein HPB49_000507 [Dermacentor silvarum]
MCRGPSSKRRLFTSGRMGAFLDKPKVEKHTEGGQGNGLRYALASMQGWRVEMEDAHCAMVGLPCGLDRWSFFAVFDGHAGARVSAHCAQNLLDAIIQTDEFAQTVASTSDIGETSFLPSHLRCAFLWVPEGGEELAERVATGIRRGFLCLDDQMRALPEVASGEDKSGSTAVCALISPSHVYFANCGDSRALLCRSWPAGLHDPRPQANQSRGEGAHPAGWRVCYDPAGQRLLGGLASLGRL